VEYFFLRDNCRLIAVWLPGILVPSSGEYCDAQGQTHIEQMYDWQDCAAAAAGHPRANKSVVRPTRADRTLDVDCSGQSRTDYTDVQTSLKSTQLLMFITNGRQLRAFYVCINKTSRLPLFYGLNGPFFISATFPKNLHEKTVWNG